MFGVFCMRTGRLRERDSARCLVVMVTLGDRGCSMVDCGLHMVVSSGAWSILYAYLSGGILAVLEGMGGV